MKYLLEQNRNDAAYSDLSQIYFLYSKSNAIRTFHEEKKPSASKTVSVNVKNLDQIENYPWCVTAHLLKILSSTFLSLHVKCSQSSCSLLHTSLVGCQEEQSFKCYLTCIPMYQTQSKLSQQFLVDKVLQRLSRSRSRSRSSNTAKTLSQTL